MEYLPSYMDSLYLEHHGILGQKWGVRRYQNEDGSLTSEGKKHQEKRNKKADVLDAKASKYKKYVSEFNKAADTLEREGINSKSKYMERMNETDWSPVYDGSKLHREAFKSSITELRNASKSAEQYAKVYKEGANYLRNNPEVMKMSYKDSVKQLRNQYKHAKEKYGWDMAEDYAYIVDDDWMSLYD